MQLSPIERMINAACVPVDPVPDRNVDEDAAVLLTVAEAAKAWRKYGPRSQKHERVTQRLKDAVDRWIAIGG